MKLRNRTISSLVVLALAVLCIGLISSIFATPAFGQDFRRPDGSVPLVIDWSDQHLIYTVGFTREQASKMQSDPRYFVQTHLHKGALAAESAAMGFDTLATKTNTVATDPTATAAAITPAARTKTKPALNKDWSVSLGAGGVAAGMAPAKYVFDVNAAPSCTADFAVFPVNASTGNSRAHVVGTFSTSASSTGTVEFTVTPTGGTTTNLTLTASTTTNTGLDFEVSTTGSSANSDTEASNLAAAINRNLSTYALGEVAAVASSNTVTVYTLTPGTRAVLSAPSQTGIANLSWGGVTAGGNGSQANIVAFDQLYSGSGTPLCAGLTYPEFIFSYASGVGPVATSPVMSLGGTQIAYVENDPNMGAILHVLTKGTGTEYGTCTNSGSAAPTCATAPVIPGSTANSKATDYMLPLGLVANATTGADSYSSPFLDYGTSKLYVGDNNGYLYSVSTVFTVGTPAHSGGNFPVTVHSTYALSPPVVDVSGTGDIFVGDSDGILYNYSSSGTLEGSSLTVGTSTAGGIRGGPIVDSTNAVGYAVTGCDSTGYSHITQFAVSSSSLTSKQSVSLDAAGCTDTITMYDPTPDNNYYSEGIGSGTPADNGDLIVCYNRTGDVALGNFQFTSGTMNATQEFYNEWTATDHTCAPLTEFYGDNIAYTISTVTQSGYTVSITTSASNKFVVGQVVTIAGVSTGTGGCTSAAAAAIDGEQIVTTSGTTFKFTSTVSATITSGQCTLSSPTATGPTQDYLFASTSLPEAFMFTLPLTSGEAASADNTASVSGGTSSMIVDNDSSSGQASSIYFGTLTTSSECGTTVYCAVKLTQSALQ